MTFIYFIISVILFYYLFKFAIRLFLPSIMRKVVNKMMNGQQGQYANDGPNQQGYGDPFSGYQKSQNKPEGKISVEYMPPKQNPEKKGTETAGEFVEFEEVK